MPVRRVFFAINQVGMDRNTFEKHGNRAWQKKIEKMKKSVGTCAMAKRATSTQTVGAMTGQLWFWVVGYGSRVVCSLT